MTTLRIVPLELSGSRNLQLRHEPQRYRDLVGVQFIATVMENALAQTSLRFRLRLHRHHVRSYESAGNWTVPADNPRYPDCRVAVDHRLHLFGKDLLSANVDHAFTSANEVIASTGTLQQIPRVDKS